MQREDAITLLKAHLEDENLIRHSLAVESIMRGLARYFNEDEDKFGLAGLLHDIDYATTADDPSRHSLIGADILRKNGIDSDIVHAVKAHNSFHGIERVSLLDKCLYSADPVSGFITAAALIRPDKKVSEVQVKSLKKRFKEKSFAKGANREQMASCSDCGLELDMFFDISLNSMKNISEELSL